MQPLLPDANDGLRVNALRYESMSPFRREYSRLFGLEKVKGPEAGPLAVMRMARHPGINRIASQETDE